MVYTPAGCPPRQQDLADAIEQLVEHVASDVERLRIAHVRHLARQQERPEETADG